MSANPLVSGEDESGSNVFDTPTVTYPVSIMDNKVCKMMGIYKDPRLSMDFKKITADPGLVLEHTQCSGPPTSGYITSNDHGKSYSDYIQKAYVLNGFEKGYGNLHFPRTEGQGNEAIISLFKAMPSVLTDAGVTQADWDGVCDRFVTIRNLSQRKNLVPQLGFEDAPFRTLSSRASDVVMGDMVCRSKHTADDFIDRDGVEKEVDIDGPLPCLMQLPCIIVQIPVLIITSILGLFCNPNTGPTTANLTYIERKISQFKEETQTENINACLEADLHAYASEFNETFKTRGIGCGVKVEKDVTYKKYTCIYHEDKVKGWQDGEVTVEDIPGADRGRIIHHDQFILYFFKV